jgi:hypothetical protein
MGLPKNSAAIGPDFHPHGCPMGHERLLRNYSSNIPHLCTHPSSIVLVVLIVMKKGLGIVIITLMEIL